MSEIIRSEIVHPGELAEHPANSNTHSPANIKELAESRKMFSQFKNIIVWRPGEEKQIEVKGLGDPCPVVIGAFERRAVLA